ncbi:hypothetical protein HDK77DRAFT_480317 [Phyllosticta capitalensis]|uniref:uncharacterized protein n=1 Tax=Phyllosticta capitalensis TaxID=121624 RepID=UPI00312EEB44
MPEGEDADIHMRLAIQDRQIAQLFEALRRQELQIQELQRSNQNLKAEQLIDQLALRGFLAQAADNSKPPVPALTVSSQLPLDSKHDWSLHDPALNAPRAADSTLAPQNLRPRDFPNTDTVSETKRRRSSADQYILHQRRQKIKTEPDENAASSVPLGPHAPQGQAFLNHESREVAEENPRAALIRKICPCSYIGHNCAFKNCDKEHHCFKPSCRGCDLIHDQVYLADVTCCHFLRNPESHKHKYGPVEDSMCKRGHDLVTLRKEIIEDHDRECPHAEKQKMMALASQKRNNRSWRDFWDRDRRHR